MVAISDQYGKHLNFSDRFAIRIAITVNAEYANTEISAAVAGHVLTTAQEIISVKNRTAFIFRTVQGERIKDEG